MNAKQQLIDGLRQKQGDMALYKFAEMIRIDQGLLSKIYAGEREIGVTTLGSIQYVFPDLAGAIDAYLAELGEKRHAAA